LEGWKKTPVSGEEWGWKAFPYEWDCPGIVNGVWGKGPQKTTKKRLLEKEKKKTQLYERKTEGGPGGSKIKTMKKAGTWSRAQEKRTTKGDKRVGQDRKGREKKDILGRKGNRKVSSECACSD